MISRRLHLPCIAALVAAAIALSLGACSEPSPNATFTEDVPDRASFPDVAQALVHHCGTLDCHGTPYRNMRIYGNEGLRFAANDQPLEPPCTTTDEVQQDYDSVVGLEPEEMSLVVAGGNPDLLTMVRKARGLEEHKGGKLMSPGDDLDTCITSWLAGQTQASACQSVGPPTEPPPTPAQPAVCQPGP